MSDDRALLKRSAEGVQMFLDFFKRLAVVLDSHPALNVEERDALKLEGAELTQEFASAELGRNNMYLENKKLVLAAKRAEREGKIRDTATSLIGKEECIRQLKMCFKRERRDFVCAITAYDVRDFGQVNKNINHDMGDVVRDCAVHSLVSTFRAESRHESRIDYPDIIARLGGDEFASAVFREKGSTEDQERDEETLLGSVERCCADFDQVQWTQYPDWVAASQGEKSAEVAAMKPPTLNPGVVIVHAGKKPRVIHSAKSATEQILKWADDLMKKSKQYEKDHGRRRIFCIATEFRKEFGERNIVKTREGYFEEGKVVWEV